MMTMLWPWDKLQQGKLWFLLPTLLLYISPENVTNQNPEEVVPGWSKFNGRSKWVWAVQGVGRSGGCWHFSHSPAAVRVWLLTAHGCVPAKDLSLAEQRQLTWELPSMGITGAIPVEQFMLQSSARGQAKLKPVFIRDHLAIFFGLLCFSCSPSPESTLLINHFQKNFNLRPCSRNSDLRHHLLLLSIPEKKIFSIQITLT